jgi:erythromycin esterase
MLRNMSRRLLCSVFSVAVLLGNYARADDVHRLDWRKPYTRSDYAFLTKLLDGKSVVQLGESIHMTDESPRVRLQLIRYLHEQLGFDVLAFEGSWLRAWLAEDLLYRCKDSVDCVEDAQRLAWFPLWQTDAMRSVLDYLPASCDDA